MSITLTYSRLRSLTQDGTVLNEIEQTGSEVLTGGVNTMTERKKLYCEFEVDEVAEPEVDEQMVLEGSKLYVSLALFMPALMAYDFPQSVPNTGFSITIPGMYEYFEAVEMPFYSLGINTTNSAKNLRCWFYWIAENKFAVELEYYNTFDENGYFTSSTKSNLWRFFSEYWDQQNTNEVAESAYSTEKEIRLITHLQRAEPTTNDLEYSETQEHVLYRGTLSKFDSVGEFFDVDEEVITSLSTRNETPMVVRMYTDENNFDRFYGKLVKLQDNPNLNFIDNYELQESRIADGEDPAEGFLIGPMVVSRDDAEGFYQMEFSINPDSIDDGYNYRLMIIGYYFGAGEDSSGALNRIIVSNPIPATKIVPYCDTNCAATYDFPTNLIFTPTLSDCQTEYSGNFLTCVIEERMRSKLIVDYSDNRWKNNVDCRKAGSLGEDTVNTNDIRKYLQSIEFEIYQEFYSAYFGGTIKHVHDRQTVSRTGANQYSTSSSNLVFSVDTVNELLYMAYDWRNRNETGVPNLITYFNGLQALAIDNQYWGGKTFFIKWRLNFLYHDWQKVFSESLDVIQKMVVKDYSNDITVDNDFELDFVCPDETLCFDASIGFPNPEDYKLINIFELSPGQLYEEENWIPAILGQLSSIYFNTQDADYTGGDAHFCIDPSTLNINQNYKFSTLAKLT